MQSELSQTDFMIHEIIEIEHRSITLLLNVIWSLTSQPYNRQVMGDNETLFAFFFDQLEIATSTTLIKPIIGILANLFLDARTRDRYADSLFGLLLKLPDSCDAPFNQLLITLMDNLIVGQRFVVDRFPGILDFLEKTRHNTRKTPDFKLHFERLVHHLAKMAEESNVYERYREQLNEICIA
jgi:hypothetical protein